MLIFWLQKEISLDKAAGAANGSRARRHILDPKSYQHRESAAGRRAHALFFAVHCDQHLACSLGFQRHHQNAGAILLEFESAEEIFGLPTGPRVL
jgi:hypothetical protein